MNELQMFDIQALNKMSGEELRSFIGRVETAINLSDRALTREESAPIVNHFSKGVYAREMRLAQGTMIVGEIHKFENLNILSQGTVTVVSQDGVKTLEAPYTFVGTPGAKRIIYAHEHAIWTVIHGTDLKDPVDIEKEFVVKDYDEIYLASPRELSDVLSFAGMTEEKLTAISENTEDLEMPMVSALGLCEIGDSPIHGKGIFASFEIMNGEVIAPARRNGYRTIAGRYCNHSATPNAKMMRLNNDEIGLIATADISKGVEILTDYYFSYKNSRRTS